MCTDITEARVGPLVKPFTEAGQTADQGRARTHILKEGMGETFIWDVGIFIVNYPIHEDLLTIEEPFFPISYLRGKSLIPSAVVDQPSLPPPDPTRRSDQPLNVTNHLDYHFEV